MNIAVGTALAALASVSAGLVTIHLGFRAPRRVETGSPADFGLDYLETRIATAGGKNLFAWWLPAQAASATAILLHGWGGNAELMLPLAIPLHKAGMNILLLDARNHGRSDAASFSSLPRFAEDIGAAVDWVQNHHGRPFRAPVVLLGHSVGAGAALLEASRRDDIAAVISVAAFAHPAWMMRRYLARLGSPDLLTRLILRYVEWIIGHRYDAIAPLNTVCRVRCPVLLVHGKADETVPFTDALTIRAHCDSDRLELLLLDNAGHDSVDRVEEHGDQLVAFLERAGLIEHRDVARRSARDATPRSV